MNKKHTLWVEKYRPFQLEGYLGNDSFILDLKEWIEKQVLETRKERKAKKELEREKRSKIKPKWEVVTSNGTSVLTPVTDKEIKEEINT